MRAILGVLALAACKEELVSSTPTVESLAPQLVCDEQLTTTLTLTGSGLSPVASDVLGDPALILPAIAFTKVSELDGSDGVADPLDVPASWVDQTTMTFDVTPELAVPDGIFDVTATNPDGQQASLPASLAAAPAPIATTVTPDRMCVDQGARPFEVAGSGFLEVGSALPTVQIGGLSLVPDGLDDCFDLAGPVGGQSCNLIEATVPDGGLQPGTWDLTVVNPETAACSTEVTLPVSIYPAPTLESIVEPLVCGEQLVNTFTLTGTGFLVVDGVNPTISIGAYVAPADRVSGCADLGYGVTSCTSLEIDVDPGDLQTGVQPVVVSNPDPIGCATTESVSVEVVAAPVIDSLEPSAGCTIAGDVDLILHGSGFLQVGSVLPVVTIGTEVYTAPVLSGCTALSGTVSGQVCDTATVTVLGGTFTTVQTPDVSIANPDPAPCTSNAVAWPIALPPDVQSIQPVATCDDGETIQIFGANFSSASEVLVGGTPAASVTFVDDTELDATLPAGIGAGVYDVTVRNGVCEDTLAAALTLVGVPYVFYVDPPVVYDQIPIRATAYVSGVNNDVVDMWIVESATGVITPVTFVWDPLTPGTVLFDVPVGLNEGFYDVYLSDSYGCDPSLVDAFYVEHDLTLTITGIDPAFGWTNDTTSVIVTASGGLLDLPRVYLSPVSPGPGTVATELNGIAWRDGSTLDAVVPKGLPVGDYNVLVVNPDGQVGVLQSPTFAVVADQPPVIDSISPGSLPNDGPYPILIQGAGFLGGGLAAPTVVGDCVEPVSGASEQVIAVVTSFTATQIDATFDANLGIGTGICVITVTNDEGTFGSYSSISVTNPAQNLYDWRAGTTMTTGRRAPGAVAGRVTQTQRYLYAIGGDDGSGAPFDTIEAAQVDPYGTLGAWAQLPVGLPAGRTLAGVAVVDRYVYLVGGNDGTTPVRQTWRAQILDPLTAPVVSNQLTIDLGTGVELAGNTYIYRVSALFDPADDENPGGESLPSDPFVVRVPDVPERIVLTMAWNPVSGAVGYRVYRSDTGSGGESWLADVATTTIVDVGAATDPAIVPLPQGSLGRWKPLGDLSAARESPCVGVAPDPVDPTKWWLFAAGGLDDAGAVHADIEVLPITVVGAHDQDAGAWGASAFQLQSPRYQCGAWVAGSDLHSKIPVGETWIYFGGGLDAGGGLDTGVDAFLVGSGDFSASYAVNDMRSRAGFGYASANNFLYAYGGDNASPDANGESSALCATGDPGCNSGGVPEPPELGNWNSLGGASMTVPRYLFGSAQESSVIFAVGGESDVDAASATVDYTNY